MIGLISKVILLTKFKRARNETFQSIKNCGIPRHFTIYATSPHTHTKFSEFHDFFYNCNFYPNTDCKIPIVKKIMEFRDYFYSCNFYSPNCTIWILQQELSQLQQVGNSSAQSTSSSISSAMTSSAKFLSIWIHFISS